ncbi:MAG: hypothetical protein ABSA57_16380 [Candidatus Acidiferrales bacterium]
MILVTTLGQPVVSVMLGIVVGIAYAAALDPTRGTFVDSLMGG